MYKICGSCAFASVHMRVHVSTKKKKCGDVRDGRKESDMAGEWGRVGKRKEMVKKKKKKEEGRNDKKEEVEKEEKNKEEKMT